MKKDKLYQQLNSKFYYVEPGELTQRRPDLSVILR